MNELQIFNNQKFGRVRGIEIDGKPYVVGNDIADALEYARPYEAVTRHCRGAVIRRILSEGGEQDTKVIPEGDIFRLVVKAADQSINPNIREKAEEFEKWIFDEVLPSIRKHGMYAVDELLDNPDLLIQVATELKKAREEKKLLEAENKLLAGQALTWTNRKVLEAIVKKYGASIHRPDVNGFQEAWREFKKELLYAHGINLNSRLTEKINSTGKKTHKTLDMIHDDEMARCISTAAALCNRNSVDISDILDKFQKIA